MGLCLKSATYFLLGSRIFRTIILAVAFAGFGSGATVCFAAKSHPGFNSAWLKLLHMKSQGHGRWKSEVSSPGFFIAPSGREDPVAEWDATYAAFSKPHDGSPDENPRCIFPARLALINQITGNNFSADTCTAFDLWKKELNAGSITVVHAAQYVQNPASIFGHLFLRFDIQDSANQDLRLDTLAYSVGFFAEMPPDVGAFDYAVKGIGGGFRGKFLFSSYARSLAEYSQIEDRDLWEYELALSAQEVAQIVNHLWEMRRFGDFEYYFLYKNCAYQLLALVEAAVPRWDFTGPFDLYLIPSDGIRSLRQQNAVRKIRYRPSLGGRLKQSVRNLSAQQLKLFWDITDAKIAASSTNDAKVLDAARDLLDYRSHQAKGNVPAFYSTLKREVLYQQSTLPASVVDASRPVAAPHVGHGPGKVSFGFMREGNLDGMTIGLRPAMHRDIDGPGYPEGLSLELLDTEAVIDIKKKRILMNRITLLRVENLREYEPIDRAFAWLLDIGWQRSVFGRAKDQTLKVIPGAGFSSAFGRPLRAFFLITTPVYGFNAAKPQVQSGVGATTGVTAAYRSSIKSRLEVAVERIVYPDILLSKKLTGEVRFQLGQDLSFDLQGDVSADAHRFGFGLSHFY